MTHIVCATNAGEDSRVVHTAAFRQAAEVQGTLLFLHVIGGDEFNEQPERMRKAIRVEMEWLLHALVRVAGERAGASGVAAEVVLRTGDPRVEILAYMRENEATKLILGVPREGDTSIFKESGFEEFVAEIEALGMQVDLISTK